ncbi:MAG: tRNA pseudouridine(13) synthase TruD [Methanothrix sp.]|nr:tRNA pseudouridine(13) synthase TruD [Methanothrix sp.]MCX8207314.1 tRNA pseudouridine(13) synthase TruD [Methanothrix sp.]
MEGLHPAPERDSALGMEIYVTRTPGIGGVIRRTPEDFVVEEIFDEDHYEGGRYLVIEVEKRDWDTHRLIREIARALRISQRRISFAGTKDRRAVTKQRMAIMNIEEDALRDLRIPDLRISVLGRTNRPLGLGDLKGNRFRIVIRDLAVDAESARERMERITSEILEIGGVPNYFGVQRFGEIRPVTHLVGEAIVRGDLERAVFTYLAMPFPDEPEETRAAREELWESRDVRSALRSYPRHLTYELAMLNHLVLNPGDHAGALMVLPENLRRMFVHAYQSYLFNRMLSMRLRRCLTFEPVEGDIVCFSRSGMADVSRTERVTAENIEAVKRLFERRRAFVTIPLIGYESGLADGEQGEIERQILESEGISRESFSVKVCPDLGSRGARRPALLQVDPQIDLVEENACIQFTLPPGSYATVVLREYMKDIG